MAEPLGSRFVPFYVNAGTYAASAVLVGMGGRNVPRLTPADRR